MSDSSPDHILLHRAIREGNKARVATLIDRGVSVHTPGTMLGNSPFHAAVLNNQPEIADFLLSRGADVNQINKYGHTAIYTSLRAGRIEQLEFLLERGIDVHAVDKDGNTYLHLLVTNYGIYNQTNPSENAAAASVVRGIEWLLDHGVDTRARNHAGQDAEDLAADAPDVLNKIRVLKAKASIDATLRNVKRSTGLAP